MESGFRLQSVIIYVELRGEAGIAAYKRLDDFMMVRGWLQYLISEETETNYLPRGMYSGQTTSPFIEVTSILQANITSEFWAEGAIILVIAYKEWAQKGKARLESPQA